MYIGCHLSSVNGFLAMGKQAESIGADTFQFFTRNPRGGKAKALDASDATALQSFCRERAFGPLVAHAPYTLNACSADEKTRQFARICMEDDFVRMAALPGNLYNFHPGSHVGQGADAGISMTCALLNDLLQEEMPVTVLFETMSGQGSEIGRDFSEMARLIEGVRLQDKVGVCLDTCHVYAAGYDIRNDLDGVLSDFDKRIGLDKLKALHLNDSKFPLGAHRDRHACIGEGEIGLDALRRIASHPALKHLPMILETPNELEGYAREIRLLREG